MVSPRETQNYFLISFFRRADEQVTSAGVYLSTLGRMQYAFIRLCFYSTGLCDVY